MLYLVVQRIRGQQPATVSDRRICFPRFLGLLRQHERRLPELSGELRALPVHPVVELRHLRDQIDEERSTIQRDRAFKVATLEPLLELLHIEPHVRAEVDGVLDALQIELGACLAEGVEELVERMTGSLLIPVGPEHPQDLVASVRARLPRHVNDQSQRFRPRRLARQLLAVDGNRRSP